MTIGTEHIILIVTTIAGVLKAYFEMKKAKAEAMRADSESQRASEAENLLTAAVEGVEDVRKENPEQADKIADRIKKRTVMRGVADIFDDVVQEVTKGDAKVARITRKLSRSQLEDELKS